MIGKKRSGKYPVYVYDPQVKAKVYVGSRVKRADAVELEATERLKRRRTRTGTWTCQEFSVRWLDKYHGPNSRRPEYTTYLQNKSQIRLFLQDFGTRKLGNIEKPEALDWAREQPEGRLKVAKAMFNDAVRDGKVDRNPFEKLALGTSRGREDISPITELELERLAEIAVERWPEYGPTCRAWILFAAWVGCRPGEMFALTWDDLDLRSGMVRIDKQIRVDGTHLPKTHKKRTVVLPPQAVDAVVSMNRLRRGLVFVSPRGRQMSKGLYRYYWHPVQERFLGGLEDARRAELTLGKTNLDLYELRHMAASRLADRNVSSRDIAHQLGNSVEVCERVYIHPYRERVNERLRQAFGRNITELPGASRERFGSEASENG